MKEKPITYKQAISLIILFTTGSAIIFTPGLQAKEDFWLATILALLFALPLVIMYERILYLFPGKDLFDVLQLIFGKWIGKLVSILYIWFSFHLGYLVIRNFGDFIGVVGLTDTPKPIVMICIAALCILAVKYGIEVIGRWGETAVIVLAFATVLVIVLLINKMDINNLRPTLYEGMGPVLEGAFSVFSFPFAELIIFTMVFTSFKEKGMPKVYRKGLLIGGSILLITSLTEIMGLGVSTAETYYFTANAVARRIDVGDFIQRVEIFVSLVFFIGGIIKVSMCLLAASKGIAKLFNFQDYRCVVTPIGLMMVNFSILSYDSVMEMARWAMEIWPYYSFPFQVILPIIIFIVIEIKRRKGKII